MKTSNTSLSGLIARRMGAPQVKAAHAADRGPFSSLIAAGMSKRAQSVERVTLASLLVSGMSKRAQQLGEASRQQHRYAQSVADRKARLQQQAAAAEAFKNRARRGYTGDDYYDNLASTKERREKELAGQDWESYLRGRKDLIQKDDISATRRKVDAEGPAKSWGDTSVGQAIGTGLSLIPQGLFGAYESAKKGISNWRNGKSFTEGQGAIWRQAVDNAKATGHDVANNFQLMAEGARHGAATIGRAVNHYARPSTWRDDADSRAAAWSRKNEWANADMEHMERSNRIVDNFREKALKDTNSTLGMLNYGLNTAVGEFAGAEAATAGVGGVAKGVGKGITAGTRAASGAVRGAGSVSSTAGLGAKAWQGARNMVARGIDTMGDTVALPFRAAGRLSNPTRAIRDSAAGAGRYVGSVLGQPVRGAYNVMRHPVQAMQYVGAHPFRAVGRVAAGTGKMGWNAVKPVMGDTGFKALAAYGAANDIANGNPGGAAGTIGDMGAYGALGTWYMPLALAHAMYGGMSGEQGGQ